MREIIRAAHIAVSTAYILRCDECESERILRGNLLDELTTQLLAFQAEHKPCAVTVEHEPDVYRDDDVGDEALRSRG